MADHQQILNFDVCSGFCILAQGIEVRMAIKNQINQKCPNGKQFNKRIFIVNILIDPKF